MQSIYDKLSESITDNGRIIFNGKDVSMRDAAFLCYYLIKKGDCEKAYSFIYSSIQKIKDGSIRYTGTALWLWLAGEYFNRTKEFEKLKDFSETIDYCIGQISEQWQKPGADWLGISPEGIYISNIAMFFGAIVSINNVIKSENAQKLILDMRQLMFKKFLDEGRVASRLGEKEINGDISIIAVPFGLLDAGNQILVRSIDVLESRLVTKGVRYSGNDMFFGGCTRSALTCLLSWYYSEKGEIPRARYLLEQVDELFAKDGSLYAADLKSSREELYRDHFLAQSGGKVEESYLSYVLYAIADQSIKSKEYSNNGSGEFIKIIHNPRGSENRYMKGNTGRWPYNPIGNDSVVLKMITQPFSASQKVHIELSVNGSAEKNVKMYPKSGSEGEKYWEAEIGAFDFGDIAGYRFAVSADGTQSVSETYHFDVWEWKPAGNVTQARNSEDGLVLFLEPILSVNTGRPCIKIKKYMDRTVKWSFNIENNTNKDEAVETISGGNIMLGGNRLQVGINNLNINITGDTAGDILKSYRRHEGSFVELLTDTEGKIHKIRYRFHMDAGESFFGMGERYSKIEYRGLDIDNYVYNQYRDQGLKTYIPVPLAISSRGYGIYMDTTMYSLFRFGTRLSDLLEIEVDLHPEKQLADMFIFIGSPKEILKSYSEITGKPRLPPKWAFGLWMSSNNWDSQTETYKQVDLTKKYEIPSTALVLEQWSDEATYYIFNDAQYQVKDGNNCLEYDDYTFPEWGRWPDPKKMVEDLHKDGIKVLLWQVPVQKYMDGIAHTQRDEDERVMLENGYHVGYKDGKPYRIPEYEWFKGSLVPDFTNPAARDWWLAKRLYLLKDVGIDGFKTDGGECIYGDDLQFFDGRTGDEMRNLYPNDYIASYQSLLGKYTGDGGVTFSRAGYTGAQNWPLHWAGDERSTFKAFKASVRAGLSCGMSGIPFWGWDMAGFNGNIPTAELYIRSVQMAAFCPVMQYHTETRGEFNNDRTPWNIAERTGKPFVNDIFKKYADLRMNLLPYIYRQAADSSRTGIPMMRAMFLEYPEDLSCIGLDGQYFFGDSLLVAPIMEEGSFTKDVYFPNGQWENLFTGERITGSRYEKVKANISDIPVYVKENSVIPLNLQEDMKLCGSVGNTLDKYAHLCFLLFVKDKVDYVFEDDLGNEIRIGSVRSGNGLSVNMESNCKEEISLIFRNEAITGSIVFNGRQLSARNGMDAVETESLEIKDDLLVIKISGVR